MAESYTATDDIPTIPAYLLPDDLKQFFEPALCSSCFVCHLVEVFREVRRVLRRDGTLWLNLGDSYTSGGRASYDQAAPNHGAMANVEGRPSLPAGLKPKDLVGIPWRVAFALQADGWYLRSDIVWSKPNPMPESVTDRPTKSHEYLFLLAKSERYFYDAEAIKEPLESSSIQRLQQKNFDNQTGGPKDYGPDSNRSARRALVNLKGRAMPTLGAASPEQYANLTGRNARSVWQIATQPYGNVKVRNVGADGLPRTVSPGCPVHGAAGPAQQVAPEAPGDALQDARSTRNPRSGESPDLAPAAGYVSTSSMRSDSGSAPESAPARTPGSGRASRTRSAPLDGSAPNSGGAASSRTNRTPASPTHPAEAAPSDSDARSAIGRSELASRTIEPSDEPDSQARSTDSHTPDRDAENEAPEQRCSCPEWYQASHFATFPEELPERCIKAGSAAQACSVCGAPWERQTEHEYEELGAIALTDKARDPMQGNNRATRAHGRARKIVDTLGFAPTCTHEAPTVGSVVLDPFNGSGTTGAVALRLGRRYVGFDLSREYLTEQALRRIDPIAAEAQDFRNGVDGAQAVMSL